MVLAMRDKSDDTVCCKSETNEKVLESVKTVLDVGDKECVHSLSISFEPTLSLLSNLKAFGEITENRPVQNRDTLMCSIGKEIIPHGNIPVENTWPGLNLRKHWESEVNLNSVHSKGSNSSTWKSFDFE